nr:hypothetical protein [Tanacetum cinerariifolium]
MLRVDRIEVRGPIYEVEVRLGHIARSCTQPKQAQENRVALDEEQLLFLPDDCVALDSDVDEAPTAQTMFMANLLTADRMIWIFYL